MNSSFFARARRQIGACLGLFALLAASPSLHAAKVEIPGPVGSTSFGDYVRVLPNGNIVVVDKGGPVSGIGAVHLLSVNGTLISTLTGSTANDAVGSGGIVVLPGGDFLVRSPVWDNLGTSAVDAGAVTWVDGTIGLSGQVSPANSLVGTTTQDAIGIITILTNGNYVVGSPNWDNGAQSNAGALTWGSGNSGVSGTVTMSNSLVGTNSNDRVGGRVVALTNGNYVASTEYWDNGAISDAGAATWGNGSTGISGAVSTANSLVGTKLNDRVAYAGNAFGIVALSSGDYVVTSPLWNNGSATFAGAVTWGNGTSGTTGTVSTANSVVGRGTQDEIGWIVHALSNGNYVLISPFWGNGTLEELGAITLIGGGGPVATQVDGTNSLVGSHTEDRLGITSNPGLNFVELANGNFVVVSEYWDNGAAADAGAVTWINGMTGAVGIVSPANSLVGTSADDRVGYWGVTALSNGNYVVTSPTWDNGAVMNVGAATWANGNGTTVGPVSIVNSLIGTSAGDNVGNGPAVALANGNYVIASATWDNAGTVDAGAVTWADGNTGITGVVSASNSLVGTSPDDLIGETGGYGVRALSNGNYVITSTLWDDGVLTDVGAVTWVDGGSGMIGNVSTANSLVGATPFDQIGSTAFVFADGRFAILSFDWDDGATVDAGAVTLGRGNAPIAGNIDGSNSVIGTIPPGPVDNAIDYDEVRHRLAVGTPSQNRVTLLTLEPEDRLFFDGFD